MNGWLLDTSILSAFAPGKPPVPPSAIEWLRGRAGECFVPVLALQEIRKGIRKLDRAGGRERADLLMTWLHGIMESYGERIVPLDAQAALAASILEDEAIAAGRSPGLADILIAATARSRSLRLLTVNMRHFEALGVDCLNPFERLP